MASVGASVGSWIEYFDSIQGVCPWSSTHYARGRIDVVTFMGIRYPLNNYSARIYTCETVAVATLKQWCDKLNQLHECDEWFWSHPSEGGNSTPIPVLIQQNHKYLQKIRNKNISKVVFSSYN